MRAFRLPRTQLLTAFAAALACAAFTYAQDEKPAEEKKADEKKVEETSSEIKPKTVVTNLDNPTGVVVHPETGHVFTASRYGIHRYVPGQKKAKLEVSGYPTDIYGKGPKYNIGPLGVAWLDKDHLIVGDGSRPDGEELVRIYKIPAEAPEKSQKEDAAAYTLGPIKAGEQSAMGEGNFYGIAVTNNAIFVTCNGDDTKGWIAKAEVTDGKPGELKPAIATKELQQTDAPGPITVNPEGGELVVGQKGEVNVAGDALILTFDPTSGELKKSYKTGLNDIVGLAYSPKTKKLYATDFSWVDPTKGALYRIDFEGDEAKPTKIIDLDKPTALSFDKEGKLYVAIFGTGKEGSDKSPGELLLIDAGL